jgi:hypothetical protein
LDPEKDNHAVFDGEHSGLDPAKEKEPLSFMHFMAKIFEGMMEGWKWEVCFVDEVTIKAIC